ncbi:MAG: hypothetical protein UT91_C0037G0002 [Parcubacteria group bacterium GW2011_GWA2_40_23]|nr:MAG: hypothetical protein UT91_C0037G0002 [Parcubacteria group bacterium GW2011_GWA2_40_23]
MNTGTVPSVAQFASIRGNLLIKSVDTSSVCQTSCTRCGACNACGTSCAKCKSDNSATSLIVRATA